MIDTILELVGEINTDETLVGEINMGSGMGTDNYEYLINKPKINNIELIKNKTLDELGIQPKGDYPDNALTNLEIETLINSIIL